MAYTIEVSNVTGIPYNLPFVLKDTKGNSYIKDVKIPRYALNHKLIFNNSIMKKSLINGKKIIQAILTVRNQL